MNQPKWLCDPRFSQLAPVDVYALQRQNPDCWQQYDKEHSHIVSLFRREFEYKPQGSAVMKITGDDHYRLYINGTLVCFGPAPSLVTAYNVDTIDVTDYLQEGINCIAVEVYYQGLINRGWVSGDNRCGFCLELRTGGKPCLVSDKTWKFNADKAYTPTKPFGYSTQFVQDYDARLATMDWYQPTFDDSGWANACEEDSVDYTFVNAMIKPLPFFEVHPVTSRQEDDGIFYDFGSEMVGYLFIKAKSKKSGSVIRIQSAEELKPDGSLMCSMRCNCEYDDRFTLAEGDNEWLQIDYKGFRYCKLIVSQDVEIIDFGVLMRHYPFDDDAFTFESKNTLFHDIIKICKRAVKINSQDGFLDCVTREKGQYSGDMTITGQSHLYLTGDTTLFAKAVEDFANTWGVEPGFTCISNCGLIQELADYSLQFPLHVYTLYRFTGDKKVLEKYLPFCERLLEWFKSYTRADGLLENLSKKRILIDWPASLRDDYDSPCTPSFNQGCMSFINAFYIGAIDKTNQIRTALGKPTTGTQRLKEAFIKTFYNRQTNLFTDSDTSSHSSLHANIMPAYFGFYPKEGHESLAALIETKGLSCGVYTAYFLLKACCQIGRTQLAFDLITNKTDRSWYNMLQGGATTCWEAWDAKYKNNNSLCHSWASAPIIILVENFLGISVDMSKPKGKQHSCNPHFPKGLDDVKLKITLPNGPFTYDTTEK